MADAERSVEDTSVSDERFEEDEERPPNIGPIWDEPGDAHATLLAANDVRAVAEAVASLTARRETVDDVAVLLRDDARLEPVVGTVPTVTSDHVVWDDQWSTTVRRYEPATLIDDVDVELSVGLGGHGLVLAGVDADDDPTREYLALVATAGSGAIERVIAERRRVTQNDVARRNRAGGAEQSRLTDVVRSVNRALVRASSRDEIERTTCEQIVGVDQYRFAWTGSLDPDSSRIEPRTRAGIADGYLDHVELDATRGIGERLRETVLADGQAIVLSRITSDEVPPYVADAAERRGYRSAVFVPVRHRETTYGVLGVYASMSHAFEDAVVETFEEIGQTVGHAINACEQRRALLSDDVIELEFAIPDRRLVPVWLSERADCRVEFRGLLVGSSGATQAYLAVEGAEPETILDVAPDHDRIQSISLINGGASSYLFRVTVGSDVASDLASQGAVVQSLTAEDGRGTATLEVPAGTDVRAFVEGVESDFPDVELRSRGQPVPRSRTPSEFRVQLESALTDRQHEVLQVAYHGGYFEWPRPTDGQSLADTLDIAQPTFLQHLRTAERKLLTTFFEQEPSIYSRDE